MYIIKQYLLFFFGLSCFALSAQNTNFIQTLDSIQHLRKLSDDISLNLEARLEYAKKASELSYKTEVDSTILKSNDALSKAFWENKMFDEYRNLNKKNLTLAIKIKDSASLGQVNLNLGNYYRKKSKQVDSAFNFYFNAENIYKNLNFKFKRCKALFGIAAIQCFEKDYTQSEVTSFKGISILESINETNETKKLQSYFYNNLGIVNSELNLHQESINFYLKSLKIKKKLDINLRHSIGITLNNLGFVYKKTGKYKLASNHLDQILKDQYIKNKHTWVYIMALENYAHTLFLSKQYKKLPSLYHKVLKIADTANTEYETIIAHQHLAEYYHHFKQKDSSKYYAYKALDISKNYYNDDILKSLKVLSKVEDDSMAVKHYEAYIKLDDSIQKNERLTRNKFARIKFETDAHIEKTEALASQNTLLSIIGFVIILSLVLIFIIRHQKIKNQRLIFEDQQQKSNEDIYSLMIQEQTNIENGKLAERHDIGEELHDGILNRLTGTRLGIEFSFLDDEFKESLSDYIKEVKTIEKDISALAYNLKNTQIADTNFDKYLKDYIENQCKLNKLQFQINYRSHIVWQDVNDIVRINLFRVLQESLQNVIKHAKASLVTFNFNIEGNRLHLNIIDNGIGFTPNATYEGIGLKNIQSRISKLNGSVCFEPENGKGTTVVIQLPIK